MALRNVLIALFIFLLAVFFLSVLITPITDPIRYSSWQDHITGNLLSVSQAGYGRAEPGEFDFRSGESFTLSNKEAGFVCPDSSLCQDSLKVTTDSIQVIRNVKAWVVVCGNDQQNKTPKFCVSIDRAIDASRAACLRQCDVQ
jgi:hypothetical protein